MDVEEQRQEEHAARQILSEDSGETLRRSRAFFNIYTGGAKAPPAAILPPPPPPLKGFGPPSNVPFV